MPHKVGPPGQPTAAKRVAIAHRILSAKEGSAMRKTLNRTIEALVLIRLGQELGTDSDLAQTLAGCIDAAVRLAAFFLG